MCGILAVFGAYDKKEVERASKKLAHRGPDERDAYYGQHGALSHERLSIIDLKTGKQPLPGCHGAQVIHNGEIYNHQQLRDTILAKHTFASHCDSEAIVHAYEDLNTSCFAQFDGVYAFALLDGPTMLVGRDPIGVKPLYYGYDKRGSIWFASELKALTEQCKEYREFPPGHYFLSGKGIRRFYRPKWYTAKPTTNGDGLREAFEHAVEKRLMSDVPIGVLLSGGLDSSLVASIVLRKLPKKAPKLKSFSIGLTKDAPDAKAAREVAKFLGTEHHEVLFSLEEGIANLERLIYHLETYDVTSIRASTPMYFLARYIHQQGVKVVLSGEGSDEIFGGYLYFHNAPSAEDFHKETIRRIKRLHTADVLRADKSTMAHAIEVRVPFLDKQFLEVAMAIRPQLKRPRKNKIEKYILRAAFDDAVNPYLPASILWRQKEQFSDGVGYRWIDGLKEYCEGKVSDAEMKTARKRFPTNTPTTKEAFHYRTIFDKLFPGEQAAKTVKKWIPKWQKNTDPSGRANEKHKAG